MHDEEARPMVNRKLKFVLSGIIAAVLLLIAGASVFRNVVIGKLKETAHQTNVADAQAHLLSLCTMQANYQIDHRGYAGSFSDLGVPPGARLQGEVLLWDGHYRIRFNQLARDQGGNVVHYTIEAKPDDADTKLPRIEIDDQCNLSL